jgi:hypothetical protein
LSITYRCSKLITKFTQVAKIIWTNEIYHRIISTEASAIKSKGQ